MKFAKCHPDRKYWAKELCHSCYDAQYAKNNIKRIRERGRLHYQSWSPEKKKIRNKQKRIYQRYRFRLEEIQKISKNQNHRCLICGKLPKKELVIDHSHTTGKFRGLLCRSCNYILGLSKDDINYLQKLIDYIKVNQ